MNFTCKKTCAFPATSSCNGPVSVVTPRAWSRLPTHLNLLRSTSRPTFRRQLKTSLFRSLPTETGKTDIGADFHGAMVAIAPGEKLFIGRRPVRNWTRRTILSRLFSCRNLRLFLGKSTKKLLPPRLHFLTPICTKSFVGWDFATDPHTYSTPQTP